jgi:RHS repeat-associated protein
MWMPEIAVTGTVGNAATAWSQVNLTRYELSNHLGNTLAVISDQQASLNATVYNMSDYTPFGMQMEGRKWALGGVYRYGFNGKENDNEVKGEGNSLDFGARVYDPRIGRFLSVDLYKDLFPHQSPYINSGNSPIRNVDYNGMFKIDAFFIKQYPTLARMIQYYLPMLKDNPEVRSSFMQVSGASSEDFDGIVSFGSGPWITPTRPDDASISRQSSNNPEVGSDNQFFGRDKKYWNNLFIADHRLAELENRMKSALKSGDATSVMEQMFLVSVCIMHESTHRSYMLTHGYGNPSFRDIDQGGDDRGFQWMKAAFGSRMTKNSQYTGIEMLDEDKVYEYFHKLYRKPVMIGLSFSPNLGGFFNRMIFRGKGAPISSQTGDPTVTQEDRKQYNYSYQLPEQQSDDDRIYKR